MTHDSCRASCGKVSRLGEWKFEDPFKATYPNKTPPWRDPQEQRHLQKFFELYNNYDANSLQPRYQFTQNNKMIWVSSDSSIPKRYRTARGRKVGRWPCIPQSIIIYCVTHHFHLPIALTQLSLCILSFTHQYTVLCEQCRSVIVIHRLWYV